MDDRISTQTQRRQTEALLFSFFYSRKSAAISLPDSITLCGHTIPFSDSARNLGFILDSELSVKKHVIKICQTAYFQLKRITSICRFVTEDVSNILVTSYILSRLDYSNCLLLGAPISVIQPLQKVRTFAARHPHGTSSSPLNNSSAQAALASHFRAH